MSNITRYDVSYGLSQPLNLEAPIPRVVKRAPTGADKAPIGQMWVLSATNTVYILTSIVNNVANWINLAGGAGVFTSLTVNPGPTNLSTVGVGAVSIGNAANTGAITITSGTGNINLVGGGNTINIGSDAAANLVNIGSLTGAASTTISSGTGGLSLIAVAGNASVFANVATPVASPTATVIDNGRVGYATFTGFTTAAAGAQVFTVTNSSVTTASVLIVSVANGGGNDAQMTITRVLKNAGSFLVTLTNNGAAALNGDVTISWWNLSN